MLRQELWGFTPHFSEAYVICTYFLCGLVLIAFGIVLLFESIDVKQARLPYYENSLNSTVTLEYNVTEDWGSQVGRDRLEVVMFG